jgi:hypothetical protein
MASEVQACQFIDSCGFVMTETVCREEDEGQYGPVILKANTFMASLTRIDDSRMMKVKEVDGQYIIDTYSVREREVMLGLPKGYVEDVVKALFQDLTENAFNKPERSVEGLGWREFLSEELHHLHLNCQFKVKPDRNPPFFHLEISSPQENKNLSFYKEDQYCKHLLGNGWSIPVVEYVLSELKGLFNVEETYGEKYDYHYPWPPYQYDNVGNAQQSREVTDV